MGSRARGIRGRTPTAPPGQDEPWAHLAKGGYALSWRRRFAVR